MFRKYEYIHGVGDNQEVKTGQTYLKIYIA
jgi:hypothetical protein